MADKRIIAAIRRMNAAFGAQNFTRMMKSLELVSLEDKHVFLEALTSGKLWLDYDCGFSYVPTGRDHEQTWDNCYPTDEDMEAAAKDQRRPEHHTSGWKPPSAEEVAEWAGRKYPGCP